MRRRYLQAQKTTCGQEEVQGRRPWKRNYGQGRTMERSKNSRRPAASARTTRKGSAGSCRALRGALGLGQVPWRQTCNHNMGQGRILERAKDNRRHSSSARTTRKHPRSDSTLRGAADRGSKPSNIRPGVPSVAHKREPTNTSDPYGDYNLKGSDNMKKQPKRERETH